VVPRVVGSNPISHPVARRGSFEPLFFLYLQFRKIAYFCGKLEQLTYALVTDGNQIVIM